VPGLKKVVDGFRNVDVAPFPKSQNQEVGLPVDRSWKFTTSGEHPEVMAAVKFALGACAFTTITQSISKQVVSRLGLRIKVLFLLPQFSSADDK
jgi:hypothetical protein